MRRLEAWLFAPGDPRRLAAVRIGLCGLLAARLATGPYAELATQPAALFRPVSFLRLLDRMPPRGLVVALQVLAVACALLAAAGLWTRVALPLAWAAALPLVAMTSSLGKVVHNDVLLLLCLVPLLPSPAGAAWSLDARRRPDPPGGQQAPPRTPPSPAFGWPVRTAMVVVAGAYLFSGLAKLLHAGLGWVTSDNLRWVLYASSDQQPAPNPYALFVADRPALAHLLAAATLVVELGFPLVLWRPRLAWLFLPAALALHAGIGLAMRLDYSAMAATAVVVLVDWPALAARRRPGGRAAARPDGSRGPGAAEPPIPHEALPRAAPRGSPDASGRAADGPGR
ncbi:MAG TPA: hypothetical protein VFL71_08085 [Actinomycetes bacterium]|nr:hypothetical protein [Actinomycetes bacterium]